MSLFFYAIVIAVIMGPLQATAQDVSLSGGSFVLGAKDGEGDEQPDATVLISPLKIDKYEITRSEYDACVRAGKCTPAHDDDGKCLLWTGNTFSSVKVPAQYKHPKFPVVCVAWQQANEYCRFMGKKLPSEAQWEYAALAGSNNVYSWGNDQPTAQKTASIKDRHPRAVGSCGVNGWGIADMTGNVWEWTADRYEPSSYVQAQNSTDPAGSPVGYFRVIRGGGWYSGARELRIKNRHWFDPAFGEASLGFRCVK